MSWLRQFLFKFTALFRRQQLEREMADEMQEHLEVRVRRYVEAGMEPEEARYSAQREFGGVEQVKEQVRDERGWVWVEQVNQDLCFTFRTLVRNYRFTLVAGFTLALGIGSAAAIFSVTDWILLRATKFPGDVFLVTGQNDNIPFMPWRYPFQVRAYEEQNRVMAESSKAAIIAGNVVIDGEPVATGWNGVSAGFLPMLGIVPSLGRGFLPGEDVDGSDHVVIVSHQFWRNHLGGQSDALGRKITVGETNCIVVGVLREAQNLPPFCPNDIFRPLTYRPEPAHPELPYLYFLGRLRPGVSREQAQQALQTVQVDVPAKVRQNYLNDRPLLKSLPEINETNRPEIYWMMLGAVGCLYAIACLNGSNLMVLRMLGQRRELSIRLALGGTRWRVVRLLAAESLILAGLASVAGLLLANWIFPLLLSAGSNSRLTPALGTWTLDGRVVSATSLLTIATALLIVAIPVFRVLRYDIYSGLKDGGNALGESPALARVRGALTVLQCAFAIMLLAGAGLMIRTIHNLQQVDLGFDPSGRVKVQLGFPLDFPSEWEASLERLREIQAELLRVPGVRAVGFGLDIIVPGYYYPTYTIQGDEGRPFKAAMAGFNIGYHEASGLILKRGAWLNQARGNEIMVNESFAQACWPGLNPVGRLVRPMNGNPARGPDWNGWVVAGVVGDIHSTIREKPGNYLYGPEGWSPFNFNTFIVRFGDNLPAAATRLIRSKLYAFDSRMVVKQITPLDQLRDANLWAERMANSVLGALASVALVLAVVGVFSVLAYTVDRRMSEFGLRMALGATASDLIGLVMLRGVRLTVAGIALGIGGALALTRYLQSLLFETAAQDAKVLAAVGLLLLLTALVACLLPAYRAAKVDITRLLRSE